jgi:hypothetical protein
MKPARPLSALVIGLAVATGGWVILDGWARAGGEPLPMPWPAIVGTVVLALALVAAGWPVRRWMRGDRRRRLDPIAAARTAVLAQAAAYGGAALAGWYLAQGLDVLPDLVGARRGRFLLGLLAALTAAGLSTAGFVVQSWCRLPPPDEDGDTSTDGGNGTGPSGTG